MFGPRFARNPSPWVYHLVEVVRLACLYDILALERAMSAGLHRKRCGKVAVSGVAIRISEWPLLY